MKQFIIKGIVCLALIVAIDVTIGYTHDIIFGNLPDKNSMVSTMYHSLFKKSAEVLILGSSTANHHYNSQMMEDSLGLTVYNLGLDGRDMVYFDVVLQSAIERINPKYVILDIGSIHLDGSWIDRIGDTKLYYGKNDAITSYYDNETDWQQKLKLKSALYRYNKVLSYLIRVAIDQQNTMKGYAPLLGNREHFERSESNIFHENETELKHLNHIVLLCKKNGVKLIMVQSPQALDNTAFDKWLRNYTSKNNVSLLQENHNESYFNEPNLFYDGGHLNSEGANILTSRIINCIFESRENAE